MSTPECITKDWKKVENEAQQLLGPTTLELTSKDVIVIVRVKNAAEYIKPFIHHYLQLGVKHLFFLDNHSTDHTVQLASQFEQVTLFQTQLPYKQYKMAFLHFLLHRFGQDCWSLVVDIDEFFDYPLSNILPLPSLIEYLEGHNFQAVVGQMLDMFPKKLPSSPTASPLENFPKDHTYYDHSAVSKHLHHDTIALNEWSNYNICVYRGGIRKTWFGLDRTELTKFPLVRYTPDWTWNSIHQLYPSRVADFSCVLYHYKFRSDFIPFVAKAAVEEQYHKNSMAYKKMWQAIQQNQWPSQLLPNVQQHPSTIKLVQQKFLVVSVSFLQFAQNRLKQQIDLLINQYPDQAKTAVNHLNELLLFAILQLKESKGELNNLKQHQHEELHREIAIMKNTTSWTLGNAIVKPLKKWIAWFRR